MAAPKKARVIVRWPRPSPAALARDTIGWWAHEYVAWVTERNYSVRTADLREGYLDNFAAWCEARGLYYPSEITRPILDRYQRTLFHYRMANGKPLSFGAQFARLVSVRVYFKWLMRRQVIVANPASEMELPRMPMQLPRFVLSAAEAEAVLRQPDVDDVLGLRDRAMMEVLYATGMRRTELVHLKVFDVDMSRGTIMIREGKGKRDRVVPLGERAGLWVQRYLDDSRRHLVAAVDDGGLFLTTMGDSMTLARATDVVSAYVEQAKLGKRGACHLFRHTAATLMLEGGADTRFIQAMLGHADISTTQVYTQVSIHKLKQVHALTHPGAMLAPMTPSAAPEPELQEMATADLLSELAFEAGDEAVVPVAAKIQGSIARGR
jgi:integrase/recombinase XerD